MVLEGGVPVSVAVLALPKKVGVVRNAKCARLQSLSSLSYLTQHLPEVR